MSEIDAARREEMRNRALLYEAAEALSSPEIGDFLPRFAELLSRVIPYDRLMVARVGTGVRTVAPLFVDGLQTAAWSPGNAISSDDAGLDHFPAQGLQLDTAGVNRFRHEFPMGELAAVADVQAAVIIGLTSGSETVGVLSVFSCEPAALSSASLSFLRRISVLLANALVSSAELAGLRVQLHEQTVMAEIARIACSNFRLDQAGPRLSEAISRLIGFDWLHVTSVDPAKGTITARLLGGDSMSGVLTAPVLPLAGTATDAVVRARTGMIITPDQITGPDNQFSDLRPALDAGLRSAIAVPLIYHGDAIGALIFRSRAKDAYSRDDVTVAERVAAQLAGPFATLLHLTDLERMVHERGVLAELGRATYAGGLDATLNNLHSAVNNLFRCDHVAVSLYDPERAVFDYRYVRGVSAPGYSQGSVMRPDTAGAPLATWPERMTGCFGSFEESATELLEARGLVQQPGLRSWVRVPLNQNDRVLGLLELRSRLPDCYSTDDVESLQRIADQVVPAIDTALHAERMEREATERAVLVEIARSILTAPDAVTLYERLEEQTQLLIPFDRMVVNRADFGCNEMEYLHVTGPPFDGPGARARGSRVPLAGTITEVVASTRRAMMFRDQGRPVGSVSTVHELTAKIVSYGFHSGMAVPLICNGMLAGTLHFSSQSTDAYTSHHLELAEQIASLLAGAVAPMALGRDNGEEGLQLSSVAGSIQPVGRNGAADHEGRDPIQILIVDSHALCRESLRALFKPGIVEIVGEADSLDAALGEMASSSPNVVLWGVHDGDMEHCDVVRQLHDSRPPTSVVLLSDEADVNMLRAAVAVGADGFLLRSVSTNGLLAAIAEVAAGGAVFDPGLLSVFLRSLPGAQTGPAPHETVRMASLTDADRAILRAIGLGQTNAEISTRMGFAVGTVKNRITRIYRAIHVSDRLGAASFAIRSGLAK